MISRHAGRNTATWLVAAAGVAALCLVFRPEINAAVSVWSSSTAYGHCWLVLPIVAWLLWERRAVVQAVAAHAVWWPALLAVPLASVWLVSRWLGIMEGRQLAALGFVLVLLLAALGWRLWWGLSAAFLYLVFLVPFGAFLTPALQGFTAGFVAVGLRVLDVPFDADSFQITIPEGVFYVAEACAGLRFLIASVAFGVLYALTMFRSPARRACFIAVSCVVPVLANGVRALGIVLLGHALGSAQAGAADHIIYGWVFFSFVIVLLAMAGLPFRELPVLDSPLPPVRATPARPGVAAAACGAVVLCALAGPVLSDRAPPTEALLAPPRLAPPPGCLAGPGGIEGAVGTWEFRCNGQTVRVVDVALSRGADPARIVGAARAAASSGLGEDLDFQVWRSAVPGSPPWMLVRARETGRIAAYAVQVDGEQGVGGLHDRLRMMRDMVAGAQGPPPLARAVRMIDATGEEDALKAVLAKLSP